MSLGLPPGLPVPSPARALPVSPLPAPGPATHRRPRRALPSAPAPRLCRRKMAAGGQPARFRFRDTAGGAGRGSLPTRHWRPPGEGGRTRRGEAAHAQMARGRPRAGTPRPSRCRANERWAGGAGGGVTQGAGRRCLQGAGAAARDHARGGALRGSRFPPLASSRQRAPAERVVAKLRNTRPGGKALLLWPFVLLNTSLRAVIWFSICSFCTAGVLSAALCSTGHPGRVRSVRTSTFIFLIFKIQRPL